MSKMQKILDEARLNWKQGKADAAFESLIEAIKLLSKGQQQVMDDISRVRSDTNFKIG